MTREEIISAWNAQADDFNQWDDLDEGEKLAWAMTLEREACAKVCDGLAAQDKLSNYYAIAAKAIRARGNT